VPTFPKSFHGLQQLISIKALPASLSEEIKLGEELGALFFA